MNLHEVYWELTTYSCFPFKLRAEWQLIFLYTQGLTRRCVSHALERRNGWVTPRNVWGPWLKTFQFWFWGRRVSESLENMSQSLSKPWPSEILWPWSLIRAVSSPGNQGVQSDVMGEQTGTRQGQEALKCGCQAGERLSPVGEHGCENELISKQSLDSNSIY